MTEHVIGIDPGLDGVGVAWLSRAAGVIAVRDVHTVRTKAALSMGARLATINAELSAHLASLTARALLTVLNRGADSWTIAIEVPTNPGRSDHAKHQGRENVNARAMMKFWQALGVIRAVAAQTGQPVVDLPPGGASKEARQAMFERWTASGRNPDERDAIVIACVQLFSTATTAELARVTARR